MVFRDLISISSGNLWRLKLRTFLTVSGVVIAIAAFVAMLSFGAGMQKNISEQFDKLGLFSTMMVYPEHETDTTTVEPAVLDDTVIDSIIKMPGVIYAYPYKDFKVSIEFNDTTINAGAQALSAEALKTKKFSQVVAGSVIIDDTSDNVIISEEFLEMLGIDSAESTIGKKMIISAKASSVDSGLINIINSEDWNIREKIKEIRFDSILFEDYRSRVFKKEANAAIKRFMDGYLKKMVVYSDTLYVSGVLKNQRGRRLRSQPIIIPLKTAKYFSDNDAGSDPKDFLAAVQSGQFFELDDYENSDNYSQLTLVIENNVMHRPIMDSIEAMGFRTYSFSEQFEEIKKFFMYFNLGLGLVGLIALVTASLGIINTMVMSTLERKKEIGILKSLGADENYIRLLFLIESSIIGVLGAVAGIVFGWVISRVASTIVKYYMEQEGVDVVELFDLPLWLIFSALAIGIIVSLAAGYFPAARAAKVNPVEALRNE